jgi:GNAT superfamily N-acetyltransferase
VDPISPFPRLTGTADVSVRPARPADGGEIARVQLVTWRTAYRQLLPAALLDAWDEAAATEAWAAAAAAGAPGQGLLVALESGTVVGFAAYAPPPDDDTGDDGGPVTEIATLLVEPRWGRRGHGSRLLAAVADLATAAGAGALRVWLPEGDQVSARFYESAGWAPDGWARTLDTGTQPLREVRWHTRLEDGRTT